MVKQARGSPRSWASGCWGRARAGSTIRSRSAASTPGSRRCRPTTGELPAVLFAAEDTPANQGLLYTAMHEAEVAAQYAGRAAAAGDPVLAAERARRGALRDRPGGGAALGGQGRRHRAGLGGRRLRRPARRDEPGGGDRERGRRGRAVAGAGRARALGPDLRREHPGSGRAGGRAEPRGPGRRDHGTAAAAIRDVATELNQGASAALEADDPACGLEEAEPISTSSTPEGAGG